MPLSYFRLRSLRQSGGHRLPRQAGFTLVEVMVALCLLLVGLLGTIKMIDQASSAQGQSRGREGATNLARELLEDAHATPFNRIGAASWITPQMQALNGGSGTVTAPTGASSRTTVTRRGISYTVTVSWCSVDDPKDGYGPKSGATSWCSDSGVVGTEATPEDMKRVTATVDYNIGTRTQPQLKQSVTFSALGGMVAPSVTKLEPSSTPPGTTPPFVVSTNVANVTFLGTSVGAADMKFSVNGVEVTSGVVNNNNGTWTYTWPIAALTDGNYTIGAVAVDALGNRSQPYTIQVTLARSSTLVPQNVAGGYNYVNPTGASGNPPPGALVVELQWDANPEGSVTGYEVLRGATSVCGGQSSLANSCIDTSPPTTGSTTYTVKTWYLNAAGTPQSVSTNYNVTAPAATVPTTYWPGGGDTNTAPTTHCYKTSGGAAYRDIATTAPTGSTSSTTQGVGNAWITCTQPLPAGSTINAGNGSIDIWFTNTSNQACTASNTFTLGHAATPTVAAQPFLWSPQNGPNVTIPKNTTTPTKYTINFTVPATTLLAADQLSLQINRCSGVTIYYNSTTTPTKFTLPSITNGSSSLATPNSPTGLSVTPNADGTRTLTWTPPASGTTVDFYRIYRDGQAVAARVDTQGVSGGATETWMDTAAGGTSHTYRVTAVSANLAESPYAGPVTG
jgi:prepilin-type N-terminal cleavage/methylation domain-containing protein